MERTGRRFEVIFCGDTHKVDEYTDKSIKEPFFIIDNEMVVLAELDEFKLIE